MFLLEHSTRPGTYEHLAAIVLGRIHAPNKHPHRSLVLSGALPNANLNFEHLKRFAQTFERRRFDAFFMADHLAVLNMPMALMIPVWS